jgi:hypothetical protein
MQRRQRLADGNKKPDNIIGRVGQAGRNSVWADSGRSPKAFVFS